MRENSKWKKVLISYYGILQTLHLLTLARAGWLILQGESYPFPILPPPEGWTQQSMAFLFGLAGTDVIGILLGIIFAGKFLINRKMNRLLGILSLTIFITGAIVFAVGTFSSGAWGAHPVGYGAMVPLFVPVPLLYVWLLRSNLTPKQTRKSD